MNNQNRFWPVENYPDLVRDTDTGAILNRNKTGYDAYVSNYNRIKQEREEFLELKDDVSSLKSDIDLIKNLLIKMNQEN